MSSTLTNVELVMWRLPSKAEHPRLAHVRDLLAAHGFRHDRAADIPNTTAFRRACDDLRDKGTIAHTFDYKAPGDDKKTLHCQIDRQHEDGNAHLTRELVGVYRLTESGPAAVNGACRATLETLTGAYAVAGTTYTWADCSKAIKTVLEKDGLGAYSPKDGHVYFAPISPTATDLLDRLERFASTLGIRFLRYTVPDTLQQRAEVADALALGISADLDAHAQAIQTYSQETRPGVIENRAEAITATETLVQRLASLLRDHAPALATRIAHLREQNAAALLVAQQNRPAARPGRRIVQTA